MSADYQPINISKYFWLALALALLAIQIFFKPGHSKFAIFTNNCYLDY